MSDSADPSLTRHVLLQDLKDDAATIDRYRQWHAPSNWLSSRPRLSFQASQALAGGSQRKHPPTSVRA
ncbi:MAG TPA: hypothetical protein VGI79_07170 [Caulobacteraceae bacterium]